MPISVSPKKDIVSVWWEKNGMPVSWSGKRNMKKLWTISVHSVLPPKEEINRALESMGTAPLTTGTGADQILKRPEMTYRKMMETLGCPSFDEEAVEEMEITVKYEGYIARQEAAVRKAARMENEKLPLDMDYLSLDGISTEARQKMDKIRPLSLGQAARIPGVSPADISVLMVYVKQRKGKKGEE